MSKLGLCLLVISCLQRIGLAQEAAAVGASATCDAHLWNFVYNPSRLPAKGDCRAVTGKIRNFVAESDGDYHIRFLPDDKSLVNAENIRQQGGALVVEPICQNTPTQADAKKPCQGYDGPKFGMATFCPGAANTPPASPVNKQGKTYTCKKPPPIRISGYYTIDNDHGWMELHTVTKIELSGPTNEVN